MTSDPKILAELDELKKSFSMNSRPSQKQNKRTLSQNRLMHKAPENIIATSFSDASKMALKGPDLESLVE